MSEWKKKTKTKQNTKPNPKQHGRKKPPKHSNRTLNQGFQNETLQHMSPKIPVKLVGFSVAARAHVLSQNNVTLQGARAVAAGGGDGDQAEMSSGPKREQRGWGHGPATAWAQRGAGTEPGNTAWTTQHGQTTRSGQHVCLQHELPQRTVHQTERLRCGPGLHPFDLFPVLLCHWSSMDSSLNEVLMMSNYSDRCYLCTFSFPGPLLPSSNT